MPFNSLRYDEKHVRNVDRYSNRVRKLYKQAIYEVADVSFIHAINSNNDFYFSDNKTLNKKVNRILQQFNLNITIEIAEGIQSEWDLAVEKNNELAYKVFGVPTLESLPNQYRKKYLSNNADALRNFITRKENGLGLSDRVWANTQQLKIEMELAMGIGQGKSATSMARETVKYLNDPDKLFRRVRAGENGELRLSKAARAYSPGQGRYRSSYKNTLRLTRNENNFSYEGSQHLKRQQQDFIVGVRIQVSPQHNPADDKGGIKCIDLQGDYPKDFDWTYKWHVNCRCMSLNIIKQPEEVEEDVQRILSGQEPTGQSKNQVKELPGRYDKFKKENNEKWRGYKSYPRTFALN